MGGRVKLAFAGHEIDPDRRELLRDGQSVHIEP